MGTYKIECNIGAACPICGEDTDHLDDERDGDTVSESYTCDNCRVIITFTWKQPKPSYSELSDKYPDGVTAKELDRAEQAERWARDQGTITFETALGHGWKEED